MIHTISVAVPRPLDGLFTYRLPAHLIDQVVLGGYVRVPFGRTHLDAFVVEPPKPLSELPQEIQDVALKEIQGVISDVPPLASEVLTLCRWASDYYLAPLGEVLAGAAPMLNAGIRKLKRPVKKLTRSVRVTRQIQLTEDQIRVVEKFDPLRQQNEGKVAVLQGVTGSGKTEVYIELARRALLEGQGVIVLLPEIALTPQLHRRFEESLGVAVGLWHSAMPAGQRRNLYQALVENEIRVIVGARSAIFAPVSHLGLIVVDEEHDATYKQEDRVRYHARDLSVVRGKLTGALVLLGSATPSLETLERVREGRYEWGELKNRVGGGGLPSVELIDLKTAEKASGTQAPLSLYCLEQIQNTLDLGQQAMVYLNRRGFAAYLLCKDCGQVSECKNCTISLTVYRSKRQLRCHHCDYVQPIPMACPSCQGINLQSMGAGTESLEDDLPRLLKNTRIARLDRDGVTSARRLNEILDGFRNGETNLLLGTQMVVKGHDFPNVTLVVVVLADSLFRWPDFRAPERAFQVLKQVSGRAGRGSKPGHVLIQTYDPEHPVLGVIAQTQSEEGFFDTERQLRMALRYPPFGRIARVRLEGTVQAEVIQAIQHLADALRNSMTPESGLEVLGPSEAFLEKTQGVFRWDLLLKAKEIQVLQRSLRYTKQLSRVSKLRLWIDVDPYGL